MRDDFETFILLIGTNPLPNYVVARYFLDNVRSLKNIILIYSEQTPFQRGTLQYAENIKKLLKEECQNRDLRFTLLSLSDISLPSRIKSELSDKLIIQLKNAQSIHLNYTGGTKTMGIHVYKFLFEKFPNITTFSYLDARNFKIVYDDQRGRATEDLRDKVKLSLREILSLHGFERTNFPDTDFSYYRDAIEIFKDLIKQGRIKEYFSTYNRDKFRENNKLINKAKKLEEKLKSDIAENPFLSIILALPEEYRIFNPDGSFKKPPSNEIADRVVKFIDGVWLEHYIYDVLKSKFSDLYIDINLEIKNANWINQNLKFQLDLILIKGYQITGISCTTSSDRRICKSKGFEIFLRTRQIGGDESKAVLITMLSEDVRRDLQEELQIDTGGSENIIVLGEKDLKEENLIWKISNYLK